MKFHDILDDYGIAYSFEAYPRAQNGDTISIKLPMALRQQPLPGDDSVNAVLYGPLVLAASLGAGPEDVPNRVIHSGNTAPDHLPAPDPLPKTAATSDMKTDQWVQTESATELRFTAIGEGAKFDLVLLYQIRDQRYSVY